MTGSPEVKERLQRLRGLGIELALDNFGTGFFSIALIRELGFHCLKIDRSLVAGLPDHAEHAAQVEAILVLGRSLGLDVIGEGVETEAERAFSRTMGARASRVSSSVRPSRPRTPERSSGSESVRINRDRETPLEGAPPGSRGRPRSAAAPRRVTRETPTSRSWVRARSRLCPGRVTR